MKENNNPFKTKLKTSHLKLGLDGCLHEHKEPFAVLKYNNIEILLPYKYLEHLELDLQCLDYNLDRSVWRLGKDEILLEMRHDMHHAKAIDEYSWHRDSQSKCSLNHDWQSLNIRLRDKNYIETDTKVEPDYGKH
jgi:hypothetical protein